MGLTHNDGYIWFYAEAPANCRAATPAFIRLRRSMRRSAIGFRVGVDCKPSSPCSTSTTKCSVSTAAANDFPSSESITAGRFPWGCVGRFRPSRSEGHLSRQSSRESRRTGTRPGNHPAVSAHQCDRKQTRGRPPARHANVLTLF